MQKIAWQMPISPRFPEIQKLLESKRFVVGVAHRRCGKTVMAITRLMQAAIDCDKPLPSFGYIAPYKNQASRIVWSYFKKFFRDFPGVSFKESELEICLEHNQAKIRLYGADASNKHAIRGAYFDGVVLDEVADMDSDVWPEIVQPMLADRLGFAILIGTPRGINLFSEIYTFACKEQEQGSTLWGAFCKRIDQTNHIAPSEVERLKNELSDNAFRQEFLCDFTASNDNVLITISEATNAASLNLEVDDYKYYPIILGVDVARFGDDLSIIFPRRGKLAMRPYTYSKKTTTEMAQIIMRHIQDLEPQVVCIDSGGLGIGVIDQLRNLNFTETAIIEVPFGGAALSDRYNNRRTEIWWEMREWIRDSGQIPNIQELITDLTVPTYSVTANGRLALEKKDEIKKRLNRSPDYGDALALTFAVKTQPRKNPMQAIFHTDDHTSNLWLEYNSDNYLKGDDFE